MLQRPVFHKNTAISRIKRLILSYDAYSREQFSKELEKLVRQKLLHIGVNTHDILKGYATIVEYLSQCDPSFVLVHRICRIIRDYVKQRPDTMRTIITFITTEKPGDNQSSEMAIANANRLTLMLDEDQLQEVNDEYVIMVDDNLENRWMDWTPDPIDANPKESRLFRESADVFNMLVSIYGSKDLFVNEYQHLLAERLVTNGWSRHLQSEFNYLETMKRRFTDGELSHCEVMLRDIRESCKLASYANGSMPFSVCPRIVSFNYWPEVTTSPLNALPMLPVFKEALVCYTDTFAQHKPARSINWYTDHGTQVELELELDGRTVQVDAPLPQAQIIIFFTEKERWDVALLAEASGLDMPDLKKRLDWWTSKGFLFHGPLDPITLEETICLVTASDAIESYIRQRGALHDYMYSDEEEEEQPPIEDVVEELEQYWNYTKGLLMHRATCEPLTAQFLHRMFKNFTSPGKTAPSLEAVQMFMQRKIKQNLVVFENFVYKATKELKSQTKPH
uniref:CULLIN_2 domain-containing protein n=1 Tax=Globodera pallida TaxID=36090 RepID=A0A183CBJ9_GLOPA